MTHFLQVSSCGRVEVAMNGADPMNAQRPSIRVPRKYAGQWIAWNHERTKIVASGRTYAEAVKAAEEAGEPQAYLTKAPEAETRFVGG